MRARAQAAKQGIPLRQFIAEAVEEKLMRLQSTPEKPWLRLLGGLKELHAENRRIDKIMEAEFEELNPNFGNDS